ncbi:MAG: hypothetical protein O3A59_11150, partial [Nitrospirae bacterium]|nr:hypothetical protein [Nitrospirota bacterium]
MKWFGAIGLFKHTYKNPEQISKFEERTVIVSSKDVEQAEKAIIEEFSDYASEELGIEFLG